MLTLPFTVAVFMVRAFLSESAQQQAAAAAVSEEQVGRMTGMLVSEPELVMPVPRDRSWQKARAAVAHTRAPAAA